MPVGIAGLYGAWVHVLRTAICVRWRGAASAILLVLMMGLDVDSLYVVVGKTAPHDIIAVSFCWVEGPVSVHALDASRRYGTLC